MARCVIFGSREIRDYELLCKVIEASGLADSITEVVSGKCPDSVDILGERWAKDHHIPIVPFPAPWDDLSHPKAVIKINKRGKKYDAAAGFRRNEEMAAYASSDPNERGIAIGLYYNSPGSNDMSARALSHGLNCYFRKIQK